MYYDFQSAKICSSRGKNRSINKAAADLFISQSVVSTAIAGLEKEIGHDIFVRSNRGVALTPFGHTFVSYVSSIQAQLVQLDSLIRAGFCATRILAFRRQLWLLFPQPHLCRAV